MSDVKRWLPTSSHGGMTEVIHLVGSEPGEEIYVQETDYARLAREVAELREKVYVPGNWRCAKCSLRIVSSVLSALDGGMSANNEPQQCSNGCGPMWRVTEREDRQDAQRSFNEQFDVLAAARAAKEAAEQERDALKKFLHPSVDKESFEYIAELLQRAEAAEQRCVEFAKTLRKVKDHLAGDAFPRWENTPRTGNSRGYLLDVIDAAIAQPAGGGAGTKEGV